MTTTIEIEQFDNGKTFKVETNIDKGTAHYMVALTHNEPNTLGELILEDVQAFCDREIINKVKLVINYEKIE